MSTKDETQLTEAIASVGEANDILTTDVPSNIEEEETSINNDADNSDASPENTSTENQNKDAESEELLTQKARAREFGSIASKTSKILVNLAETGDKKAVDTIKGDKQVLSYVKTKYPEFYNKFILDNIDSSLDNSEIKSKDYILKIMREEQKEEKLSSTIEGLGVKGEDNFDKVKERAEALMKTGLSLEEATKHAYSVTFGEKPKTQTNIPSNSYNNSIGNNSISNEQIEKTAKLFGVTKEHAEIIERNLATAIANQESPDTLRI